jgi:hypothetical protein
MQIDTHSSPELEKLKVFKSWGVGQEPKVPSQISYAPGSLNQQQWGFSIEAGAPAFRWTKLALRSQPTIDELESMKDLAEGLSQLSRLESGDVDVSDIRYMCKTPEDIVADYLAIVSQMWEDSIRSRFTTVLDEVPIDLVITHPAVSIQSLQELGAILIKDSYGPRKQ